MPSRSFSLGLAVKLSELVLKAVERGEDLKKLKSRLLELMLNPREINVGNVCESLRSITKLYYEPLVEGLLSLGYCVVEVEASLTDKLLVGASGGIFASLLEVGLSWNHVFDLPFIPGSAVKGAMRSLMLYRCSELSDARERCDCASAVLEVVGASENPFAKDELGWVKTVLGGGYKPIVEGHWAGRVFVADAFPVERGRGKTGCGILDFDVITPHYYRGGEVVKDEFEANPVPVPHLVVAPGTKFRFVVAVDRLGRDVLEKLSRYLGAQFRNECQLLITVLQEVLEEGVGARTSKGYGVFDVTSLKVVRSTPATRARRRSFKLSWGQENSMPQVPRARNGYG